MLNIDTPKKIYEWSIDIHGAEYVYQAIDGELFVSSISDNYSAVIPAGMVLKVLKNISHKDAKIAKCPWCLGVGIVVFGNQLLCSATEGGAFAYCNATCQCGVKSIDSTCVGGFRQTSCVCWPCQQTPIPPPVHPGFGGWGGPVFPGATFGPRFTAPWVIPGDDDPY